MQAKAKKLEKEQEMAKQREAFLGKAGALDDEAPAGRAEQRQASFDKIVAEVRAKRRARLGEWLKWLALSQRL